MIPIRFGIRFAGLITLASGISVATRVFHIWYLPIIPLGTYRMHGDDTGVPTNSGQLDTDFDGLPDARDLDSDNDSIPDLLEGFVGLMERHGIKSLEELRGSAL